MSNRLFILILVVVVPLLLIVELVVGTHWKTRPDWRLDDEKPAVRAAAIRALPLPGNESTIIGMLEDEDADVRLVAVAALVPAGYSEPAARTVERARALVRALGDERLAVRRQAIYSLSWLGQEAEPVFQEALVNNDPRVRAGAIRALVYTHKEMDGWHYQRTKIFKASLERLLKDPDPEVRETAASALGREPRRRE